MRQTWTLAVLTAAVMSLPLVAQEPFDSLALAQGGPRWFTAWASAHNVGRGVQGLSGGSVRLIVRPTLSGQSLRVKVSNIRGNAPAVFSAAYVGVSGDGSSRGRWHEPPADIQRCSCADARAGRHGVERSCPL